MKILAKLILALTLLCGVALGDTITPTVVPLPTANNTAYGSEGQKRITVGSDGFDRMVLLENSAATFKLKYVRCLDAACSSFNSNTIYSSDTTTHISTGCTDIIVGARNFFSLALGTSDLARVAIIGVNHSCGGSKA